MSAVQGYSDQAQWKPTISVKLIHTHMSIFMDSITVVSRVSAQGHLNITHDFGPHGRLPGIKIPYVCIEAATVAP